MKEIEEIKNDMNQPLDIKEGISKSTLFSYIATLLSSLEKAERRVSELDGAIIGWKIIEKTLKKRIKELEKAVGGIKTITSNRENAVLLGAGWTIATIDRIVKEVLEKVRDK